MIAVYFDRGGGTLCQDCWEDLRLMDRALYRLAHVRPGLVGCEHCRDVMGAAPTGEESRAPLDTQGA